MQSNDSNIAARESSRQHETASLHPPSSPQLAALAIPALEQVNSPAIITPYPPLAEGLFAVALIEERIAALHQAMGEIFEKRVQNVLRQFRCQNISGRAFGTSGQIALPSFTDVRAVVLPDSDGVFSGKPGGVEIDGVGCGPSWPSTGRAAFTVAQVDRFIRAIRFY